MPYSTKQLIFNSKLRRYKKWLEGQRDRQRGKPCMSADGIYLYGWHSPEELIPDFLTINETVSLRRAIYMEKHLQASSCAPDSSSVIAYKGKSDAK